MPSLSQSPAQAPPGGITNSSSFPDSEAYYSNDDIEILYSVVSRAQDILNDLPEGERLATNALFSAYDEVLPLYGIDPEEDHHISRLIFRIGGERGVGSLLDRCRDVLLRMGIELDLGSDSHTTSSTLSLHHGTDVVDTAGTAAADVSTPIYLDTPAESEYAETASKVQTHGSGALSILDTSSYRIAHGRDDLKRPARPTQALIPGHHDAGPEEYSTEDRHGDDLAPFDVSDSAPKVFSTLGMTATHARDSQYPHARTGTPVAPRVPGNPSFDWMMSQIPERTPLDAKHDSHSTFHQGNHTKGDSKRQDTDADYPRANQLQAKLDDLRLETQYQRLKRRASRAWVLLQLTRAVSHWTAFSEERIERAAIARRHILRVRYFSSWVTDVVENKRSQSQKALQKHASAWSNLMHNTLVIRQTQHEAYQQDLLRRFLRQWTSASTDTFAHVPRSIVLRTMRQKLQYWQGQCRENQSLSHQSHTVQCLRTIARIQASQRWVATHHIKAATRFRQYLQVFEVLRLWSLVVRSRQLEHELRSQRVQMLLRHWHGLRDDQTSRQYQASAQPLSADSRLSHLHGPEAAARRHHRQFGICKVFRNWRDASIVTDIAHHHSSINFARREMRQALSWWHAGIDHTIELAQWAHRAREYLAYTSTLRTWKHSVPRWSSSMQRAYVRCRWRHKALIARKKLSEWRVMMRHLDVVVHVGRPMELQMATHRLGHTLGAWQHQCRVQATLESPAYLHDVWLNEWAVSSEGLHLVEYEASSAWAQTLKSKVWSKWRSVSVQLHSQLYIVTDVTEKNTRKSVRRILLFWKARGDGLHTSRPSSFVASSYGISRGSRAQDSLLWSKTRSGQTAASSLLGSRVWPGDPDEDDMEHPISEADEMQDAISTPTRRIGFEASLARLPTTTPLAPLSTPFERELRGRYGDSVRSTQAKQSGRLSVRGTPRLSTVEARRIAEQRRRRRPG